MARVLSLLALCVAALLVCAPAARAQTTSRFGATAPSSSSGGGAAAGCAPPRQHARAPHARRADTSRHIAASAQCC
jgi:hypothetical protein